eukprot:4485313-Amphidinium_carterae.2
MLLQIILLVGLHACTKHQYMLTAKPLTHARATAAALGGWSSSRPGRPLHNLPRDALANLEDCVEVFGF